MLWLIISILLLPTSIPSQKSSGLKLINSVKKNIRSNLHRKPVKQVELKALFKKDGEKYKLLIKIKIREGWHIYHTRLGGKGARGKASRLVFSGGPLSYTAPLFPPPKIIIQKEGIKEADSPWVFIHKGTIKVWGLATPKIAKNKISKLIPKYHQDLYAPGTVTLYALACKTLSSCVPVKVTDNFTKTNDIEFAHFPASTKFKTFQRRDKPDAQHKIRRFSPQKEEGNHSYIIWLLLAFLGGLILNIMPCVLPVLSIKIYSLVEASSKSKRAAFKESLAYSAGMISLFLILGAVSVVMGLSWGEQFQSSEFTITLISLIFIFSLWLFGIFSLNFPFLKSYIPRTLTGTGTGTRTGSVSKRRQATAHFSSSFFTGAITTLMATPCTGPFLGATLAFTMGKPAHETLPIFFVMGLGMATPHLLTPFFNGLLKLIPPPGRWMESFKQFTGFMLMGSILWLMLSLKTEMILPVLGFLLFLAISFWLFGRFYLVGSKKQKVFIIVSMIIVISASGIFFFTIFSRIFSGTSMLGWNRFTMSQFHEMEKSNTTIIIDFTAKWCPNCRWNENMIYRSKEIKTLMKMHKIKGFIVDMTHKSAYTTKMKRFMRTLGGNSLPFMAVFKAKNYSSPITFHGIVSKLKIKTVLKSP